jgi:hypothetical protein
VNVRGLANVLVEAGLCKNRNCHQGGAGAELPHPRDHVDLYPNDNGPFHAETDSPKCSNEYYLISEQAIQELCEVQLYTLVMTTL